MTAPAPREAAGQGNRKPVVIRCQRESVGEWLLKLLRRHRLWSPWWWPF